MDDIYISLAFKEEDSDLRTKFNSLAPCISDCFNEKLGLRLNPKTMIFRLRKEGDRAALERNLKMISPDGTEDTDNTDSPKKKIKHIFNQLKKLKGFPIAPYFQDIQSQSSIKKNSKMHSTAYMIMMFRRCWKPVTRTICERFLAALVVLIFNWFLQPRCLLLF